LCATISASVEGKGEGGGVGSAGIAGIVGAVVALFPRVVWAADRQPQADGFLGSLDIVLLVLAPAVLWLLWKRRVIRAVARGGARELSASPIWIWPLGAFVVFFCLMVGADVGRVVAIRLAPQGDRAQDAIISLVSQAGAAVVGLLILARLRMEPWGRRAGLEVRPRARDLLASIGGLALSYPLVQAAAVISVLGTYVITGKKPDVLAHEKLRELHENPCGAASAGVIVAAVVLAPIVEEILFRVLIQSFASRLIGKAWPAILLSAALFGAAHVGASDLHSLVPLAVFGVCLGAAYERTGRMWVNVGMHALFNAINIAVTLLTA
jgi:membrane protease YdiL (CAAX protease family)